MSKINPKVSAYLRRVKKWREELEKLRRIILDCGLTEEWKWSSPVYTFQKKNVIILWGFKDACTLGFFKGVLIKDPKSILNKAGPNSRSARVIRFTDLKQIINMESVLKAYIRQAIKVEKAGLKVDFKKNDLEIPQEFQERLNQNPALKDAFEALTPGRQRGYILYFSAPKQSKSREARIEKYTDQILDGIGLYDAYLDENRVKKSERPAK